MVDGGWWMERWMEDDGWDSTKPSDAQAWSEVKHSIRRDPSFQLRKEKNVNGTITLRRIVWRAVPSSDDSLYDLNSAREYLDFESCVWILTVVPLASGSLELLVFISKIFMRRTFDFEGSRGTRRSICLICVNILCSVWTFRPILVVSCIKKWNL